MFLFFRLKFARKQKRLLEVHPLTQCRRVAEQAEGVKVQRAGSPDPAGTLPDLLPQPPREVHPAVSPNPRTEVSS